LKNPLNKIVRSVRALGRELARQTVPESPPIEPARKPKIGIALGGGFARGLAHIGILKVLEEENIPVDFIAGTSVGSVIGAAYASGISAKELEEIAALVRFKDFSRWTFSRFGLFSNDKMSIFLRKILRCKTFEDLKIPLAIAATDIITGDAVVFTKGDLVDPVRASCAYPGMFLPVNIRGHWLVDGMLSHPVPSRPVREMGAERVLAVHLKGQWSKNGAPRHLFDVIGQSFAIAQDQMSHLWRGAADVVVEPDVAGFAYDDFKRAGELIRAGEVAMRKALPEVLQWMEKPAEIAAPAKPRPVMGRPAPMSAD